MVWSGGALPLRSLPPGSDWLLGFNEPNYRSQANMSPAYAASLWPQLEATGRRLVGPAMADCGEGLGGDCTYSTLDWYSQFLGNCTVLYPGVGCRLDAVALHLYYCSGQDMVNKLTALYEVTLRPVWLTEFACNAPSSSSQPTSFAQSLLPRLEALPIVQRYSWFISYCAGCGAGDLLYDSLLLNEAGLGQLTQVGQYYSAFQSYSAITVDALTNPQVLIDCGNLSPSVDGVGQGWLADVGFNVSTSTVTPSTSALIALTPNSTAYLYQTFRSGAVQYTIPVSAVGMYTVTLFFSEYLYQSVGQRVFGIVVQGTVVASAYDIIQQALRINTVAYVQLVCAVTQSTGLQVTVQLTPSLFGQPLIAALSVEAGNSSALPALPALPTPPSLYLSMAGTAATDAAGHQWVSGLQYTVGGTVAAAVTHSILGSPADLLFVYSANLWGAFSVSIPVTASGWWQVTLFMAECYWSSVGQRVFSVTLQGVVVESSLDIIARAGGKYTALNTTYNVTVAPDNAYITLTTHNIVDNALLSGIALTHIPDTTLQQQTTTGVPATATPSITSSSQASAALRASSLPSTAVAATSTGASTPLAAGSLCFLVYGGAGNIEYPWSAATQLSFLFNPTPITTASGTGVSIVSGSGSRTYTNSFGITLTTQLTVSSLTDNILYLNRTIPLDSSGLTLTFNAPIQLPGGGPTTLFSTMTLRSVTGSSSTFIAEENSSRIDASGETFTSSVPGFMNLTVGAANVNALAVQIATCQAPVTFTNGLRQPTQPSASNGALHLLYSYYLSDGLTYSVQTNLSISTTSQFASTKDALGNPFQTITAITGTRTYTYFSTGGVVSSTVTFPGTGTNRFYPYALLASAPGIYTVSTAPFIDGTGLTFAITPSAPALGAAPGSGTLSSTINVLVATYGNVMTQLNEAAYVTLPAYALQQQVYTLQL